MLMERNASILTQIISNVAKVNSNPLFLIATNPVDIITHISINIAKEFGIPSTRIIRSGTTLDTARVRNLLGNHVGVDPQNIHANIIGEHGDYEVLTWSNIDIGGVSFEDYTDFRKISFNEEKQKIDAGVRNAFFKIIDGKGSTYYGTGAAIEKLNLKI